MAVTLNPYLLFDGNAEEAAHFYGKVFGAEPTISRFGDDAAAMEHTDEKYKNNVMHGDLKTDDIRLMVSDSGPMGTPTNGGAVSVSLSGNAADLERLTDVFNKLSEGGKVEVPLSKAPWGDTFGMLKDKYGFDWMVNIAAE